MGSSADEMGAATGPIRPEDVPADLVDAVYPACLEAGIPWHDDAVRILAAAVLTEARRHLLAEMWRIHQTTIDIATRSGTTYGVDAVGQCIQAVQALPGTLTKAST